MSRSLAAREIKDRKQLCARPGADAIASRQILIPEHVEDGLNLIWNSLYLVIIGGGTMNRGSCSVGSSGLKASSLEKLAQSTATLPIKVGWVPLETVEDIKTKIKAVRMYSNKQRRSG